MAFIHKMNRPLELPCKHVNYEHPMSDLSLNVPTMIIGTETQLWQKRILTSQSWCTSEYDGNGKYGV